MYRYIHTHTCMYVHMGMTRRFGLSRSPLCDKPLSRPSVTAVFDGLVARPPIVLHALLQKGRTDLIYTYMHTCTYKNQAGDIYSKKPAHVQATSTLV